MKIRLPYVIGALLLAGFFVTSFAARPGQLAVTRLVLLVAAIAFLFGGLIGHIRDVNREKPKPVARRER